MRRKTAQILYSISFLVGIPIMAIFLGLGFKLLAYATVVAVFVTMLICGYHLRCRKCGRMPGKRTMFAKFCPHCGEPMD